LIPRRSSSTSELRIQARHTICCCQAGNKNRICLADRIGCGVQRNVRAPDSVPHLSAIPCICVCCSRAHSGYVLCMRPAAFVTICDALFVCARMLISVILPCVCADSRCEKLMGSMLGARARKWSTVERASEGFPSQGPGVKIGTMMLDLTLTLH
jgi:hypothetical protein